MSRGTVIVAILCFLIATGTLVLRSCRHEPTISTVNNQVVEALFDGDSGFLASRILSEELSSLGWSREDARKFIDQLIVPAYRGRKLIQTVDRRPFGNGAKENLEYRYRDQDGAEFNTVISTFGTDEGGRISISHLLQQVWLMEYRSRPGHVEASGQQLPAAKQGLVRDYSRLKQMGFSSFFDPERGKSYKSLDQAFEDAKTWLSTHPH